METVDSSPPNEFTSSHPPPLQLERFKNAEMHSSIGNSTSVHRDTLGLESSHRMSSLTQQDRELLRCLTRCRRFGHWRFSKDILVFSVTMTASYLLIRLGRTRLYHPKSPKIYAKAPPKNLKSPPLCTTTTRNTAQRVQKKRRSPGQA